MWSIVLDPVVWSVVLDPVVLTELNRAGDFPPGGQDNMIEWPVFTSPLRRPVGDFLRVLRFSLPCLRKRSLHSYFNFFLIKKKSSLIKITTET